MAESLRQMLSRLASTVPLIYRVPSPADEALLDRRCLPELSGITEQAVMAHDAVADYTGIDKNSS